VKGTEHRQVIMRDGARTLQLFDLASGEYILYTGNVLLVVARNHVFTILR
jgi:hypothetical protein